jgi:nickel/cobalt transporter (NiCoT) family protein
MPEILLALVLGFKHGLDPDHLALIDNLARLVRLHAPRCARFAGLLFSLGHSAAICLFTVTMAMVSRSMDLKVPAWLESSGIALSATALILLALMNLASLNKCPHALGHGGARYVVRLGSRKAKPVAPARSASRLGQALVGGRATAWGILFLGAMFALSFDTITQAALFAGLSQGQGFEANGVLLQALLFSTVFGLGMICADTLNGLFVNKLLNQLSSPMQRADLVVRNPVNSADYPFKVQTNDYSETLRAKAKAHALRFMTISLSILSLVVAGLALTKLLAREILQVRAWGIDFAKLDGQELLLGLAVITWVLLSYLIAASIAFQAGRAAPTS